jgi:hypothetical protein
MIPQLALMPYCIVFIFPKLSLKAPLSWATPFACHCVNNKFGRNIKVFLLKIMNKKKSEAGNLPTPWERSIYVCMYIYNTKLCKSSKDFCGFSRRKGYLARIVSLHIAIV